MLHFSGSQNNIENEPLTEQRRQSQYGGVASADVAHCQRSIPTWRQQIGTKMFRMTAFLLGAYVVFWAPYNLLFLISSLDKNLAMFFSDHLHWLRDLILLNAVVNPFLYQFGRS